METLNEKHKKSREHSARLKNPGKFVSFTTGEDKGGKGVNFIYGIRKDAGPEGGKTEIQAIRFDSNLWSVDDAKKWLSDHDKKYIKFTAATIKEDSAPVAPAAPAAPAASSGPAITTSNMGAKYAPKVLPMTSHYGDYTVDRFDQSFMKKMKKSLGEAVVVEDFTYYKGLSDDDYRYYKKLGAKKFVSGGVKAIGKKGKDYVFISTNGGANTFTNKQAFLDRLKSAIDPHDIRKVEQLVDRLESVNEADELPVNAPKSEPAINPDGTPADAPGKDLMVPRDTDAALFDDYVKIYNDTKPEERATSEKLSELAASIIKKYFGDKKTQWGSDGVEVMDDQLIFKNFSSSEDVSVDEAYRPLAKTEKILYGTRKGQPDYTEEIITTDPSKFKAAKEWAKKQGFDRFREASIDMMKAPDFSKTIRKEGINEASGITIGYLENLVAKNNEQYGTTFEIGGAYGNYELWATDKDGHHRLEAGSKKDIYNTFVKYRFDARFKMNKPEVKTEGIFHKAMNMLDRATRPSPEEVHAASGDDPEKVRQHYADVDAGKKKPGFFVGGKTMKEAVKIDDVVEDDTGKKFRVYNISPNWAALIPVDTDDKEYSASDKKMIPVGDLYEFYRKVSK